MRYFVLDYASPLESILSLHCFSQGQWSGQAHKRTRKLFRMRRRDLSLRVASQSLFSPVSVDQNMICVQKATVSADSVCDKCRLQSCRLAKLIQRWSVTGVFYSPERYSANRSASLWVCSLQKAHRLWFAVHQHWIRVVSLYSCLVKDFFPNTQTFIAWLRNGSKHCR